MSEDRHQMPSLTRLRKTITTSDLPNKFSFVSSRRLKKRLVPDGWASAGVAFGGRWARRGERESGAVWSHRLWRVQARGPDRQDGCGCLVRRALDRRNQRRDDEPLPRADLAGDAAASFQTVLDAVGSTDGSVSPGRSGARPARRSARAGPPAGPRARRCRRRAYCPPGRRAPALRPSPPAARRSCSRAPARGTP